MKTKIVDDAELRKYYAGILRGARLAAGISQAELAARMGVHRSFVSQIERAALNMSLDTLERFRNAIRGEVYSEEAPVLREKVGTRLREFRMTRALTQEGLSSLVGMSALFVGRVERAEVSTSIDIIQRLAAALKVPGKKLIGEEKARKGPGGS